MEGRLEGTWDARIGRRRRRFIGKIREEEGDGSKGRISLRTHEIAGDACVSVKIESPGVTPNGEINIKVGWPEIGSTAEGKYSGGSC